MSHRQGTLREGLIIGLLGGSAVAIWFLLVDTVTRVPLFTPTTLGAALFGLDASALTTGGALIVVAGYTLFHYAAFVAVGTLAVALIHAAERQPALLALFVLFFAVFQLGFYGMVAALSAIRLLDGLEWYQIAIGNLLASLVMGGYLWRAYPALADSVSDALSH
jgi:hypothetical protein